MDEPGSGKSPRLFKIEDGGPKKENRVWASDLTYLPTNSGFCYLVVVIDLFNREIKGWNVAPSMEARNTTAAFMDAAKKTPGNLEGLVFHSDRGIQYCSSVVRDRLKLLGVAQSMSRKGNCHDNAFAESFFHTLKNELEKGRFKDLDEARAMVSGYINWYNRERMHSSLGYSSPMDYVNRKVGNVA